MSEQEQAVEVNLPEWHSMFYEDARYYIVTGGRSSAKSWTIATHLLLLAVQEKKRVVCVREYLNKTGDSIHELLSKRIYQLGLEGFFDVQAKKIIGINGSEFIYVGMKTNPEGIKSFEGVDYCWVEEADPFSENSWRILIPTVLRQPGSKMFISFNPTIETSSTCRRFYISRPNKSVWKHVTYLDNPFCSEETIEQAEEMKREDYALYEHIWLGKPYSSAASAVFEAELAKIEADGRHLDFSVDYKAPTYCSLDLGWDDMTCIWFFQPYKSEFLVVDYYENRQQLHEFYAGIIRNSPYNIAKVFLPHDSRNASAHGQSWYDVFLKSGLPVQALEISRNVQSDIDLAKRFMNRCFFRKDSGAGGASDGLEKLRHYSWASTKDGQAKRKPRHDEYSHAADAFRYGALALYGRPIENSLGDYNTQVSRNRVLHSPIPC